MKTVYAVYFSPVDGTRRVVCKIAERIADAFDASVKELDFTRMEARGRIYEFSGNDIVVFGSPVYAGRIPNKIMPDWKRCFVGNGAAAVAVCTFGNRSYDGALDELHLILQQNGFRVLGKAAAVCQHVFSEKVGAGRPDAVDWAEILAFADEIAEKYAAVKNAADGKDTMPDCFLRLPEDFEVEPYYTPLKTDGMPAKFLKAKPLTKDSCTGCGFCVSVCPMGSIDADDPRLVSGVCIKCQACIRKCPKHAKHMEDGDFLSHVKMLEEHYTARTKNTFIC